MLASGARPPARRVWVRSIIAFFAASLPLFGEPKPTSAAGEPANPPPATAEVWGAYQPQTKCLFDATTLVKRWVAPALPGATPDRVVSIQPAIRKNYNLTEDKKPAVQTVRASVGTPAFELPLGQLGVGCYNVRTIAMARTEDVDFYRKPLYVELTIRDTAGGEPVRYRQRVPYWDDFYSVAEIYFNVDKPSNYSASLSVGAGSAIELYVNAIEFHNVLAGTAGKAAKAKSSTFTNEERDELRKTADAAKVLATVQQWTGPLDPYLTDAKSPELTVTERAERDWKIWNAFPLLNSQFISWFPSGFPLNEITYPKQVESLKLAENYGQWTWSGGAYQWQEPLELMNDKLKLRYTRDDFSNYRPLPDPYPMKDDGGGVYLPKRDGLEHADNMVIIAEQLRHRWTRMVGLVGAWDGNDITHRVPYLYHALGNKRAARDAALALCKWAYIYPTFTHAQTIDGSFIAPGGIYQRDLRLHIRYVADGLTGLQQGLAMSYDYLYDYIKGNDELAAAVNKFVPWVKTEADVRRLIESRVLQFGARQSMYFNLFNDKESPTFLFRTACVQQDPAVTRPWMEFLWRETWIYPHRKAGVPDYISSTTQRDGTTDIGSAFYASEGSPFAGIIEMSRRYVANGGDKKYDLTDPKLYGKALAADSFLIDQNVAGGFPLSIGDVGGPTKPRFLSQGFVTLESKFKDGYQLTGDKRFAWIIANYFRHSDADLPDAFKRDVEAQKVNPYLESRPRVMASWAGILEQGGPATDFRLKTAAVLRVGTGYGHAHNDTLDLQLIALGARMLNDVGWRGGYSMPQPTSTQMHNLVEVNGGEWHGHAWIDAFSPDEEASYMRGVAAPTYAMQSEVKHRSREVALISVSPGNPGGEPPAPLPYMNATKFDPKAVMPQRYLFDVQRTSGGRVHTLALHGTVSDDFSVNLTNRAEPTSEGEKDYLHRFLQGEGFKYAGDAAAMTVATWRLRRSSEVLKAISRDGQSVEWKQGQGEQDMLGGSFDEAAPRRFVRAYIPANAGDRALVAYLHPVIQQEQTTWPFFYLQRRGEKLESAFASVIEPYSGEPFIAGVHSIAIAGAADDALKPVAVEVTTKDGRKDLCFSNGRDEAREVEGVRISGRFAYVSRDAVGVRAAKLVEGTSLMTEAGRLSIGRASWSGAVTRVDYTTRRVWLSGDWSGVKFAGQQIELGNDLHKTSFTVVEGKGDATSAVVTLDKAIDLGYAHVAKIDAAKKLVAVTTLPLAVNHLGMNAGLTCTNGDMTKAWKCKVVNSDNGECQLDGSLAESDLPVGASFRLWEFGVGDTAKLVSHASIVRQVDGTFKLESNGAAKFERAK